MEVFDPCGLRYDPGPLADVYRRLGMTLEDSTTYQRLLQQGLTKGEAQGAVRETRKLLTVIGTQRVGPPAAPTFLDAITGRDRLERMAGHVLGVASWDALLATP